MGSFRRNKFLPQFQGLPLQIVRMNTDVTGDGPPLVYADCLEERGDSRANYIRVD